MQKTHTTNTTPSFEVRFNRGHGRSSRFFDHFDAACDFARDHQPALVFFTPTGVLVGNFTPRPTNGLAAPGASLKYSRKGR